jgi:penicillin-binding protein 1A
VNGQVIDNLYQENRVEVPLSEISPYKQQAIVAIEDERFYQHLGIDPIGVARALWVDIKAGRVVEGGSTITQQTAKNQYLTQDRTIIRKIKELILTIPWRALHQYEILHVFETIY